MDYMNIPLFDEDFYKMAFLFFINFFFLTIIIRWFYYGSTPKKHYLFTYYLIGVIVFSMLYTQEVQVRCGARYRSFCHIWDY